jgi:hypothetical protein
MSKSLILLTLNKDPVRLKHLAEVVQGRELIGCGWAIAGDVGGCLSQLHSAGPCFPAEFWGPLVGCLLNPSSPISWLAGANDSIIELKLKRALWRSLFSVSSILFLALYFYPVAARRL